MLFSWFFYVVFFLIFFNFNFYLFGAAGQLNATKVKYQLHIHLTLSTPIM